MSISEAQRKVHEFHERFGVPRRDSPSDGESVEWDRHWTRIDTWIRSEVSEGMEACDDFNVSALADAYIDIIYFALGGLVELGIDGGPLFDAVHAANMLKVKLPGVAKIAKPPGWRAPDIAALIEAQRGK